MTGNSRQRIVLFDTETTGFPRTPIDKQPDDVQPYILQLHAVLIEHDGQEYEVVETLSSYISGAPFIAKSLTDIHGISMETIQGQPPWSDIREQFFDMCLRSGHVGAHNFEFDARMVQIEEKRLGYGRPFQGVKHRCSLLKSRRINKDARSHNLGRLYKHLFNEDMANAHTADGDVAGLIRVYMDLVSKGAWS